MAERVEVVVAGRDEPSGRNDVVLLDASAVIGDECFERLRRCAASDARIGTVVPWSAGYLAPQETDVVLVNAALDRAGPRVFPDFIDDRDSLAVVAEGEDAKGKMTVRYDLTAHPQRQPPLSAVARDTGFPPSIVAQLILAGRIRERGVLPPERAVPVGPFLDALAERGMRASLTVSRPA